MRSKNAAAEIAVIVLALGTFFGYHAWFFFGQTRRSKTTSESRFYGITGKGKLARLIFTQMVSSQPKAGILGIQQCRNGMMGASFQASIAALFFNVLLEVLVSPAQLKTLQRFANVDPLLTSEPPLTTADAADAATSSSSVDARIGVVTALVVIVMNLVVILVSLLFFVVCVRLYIHAGYYYRAATHPSHLIVPADALAITLQAQVIYTIGQRLIFFFPITTMWLMGPSVMLFTSIIVTTGIFFLDRWDPRNPERHMATILKMTPKTANHPETVKPSEAVPVQPAPEVVVMRSNPLLMALPTRLPPAPSQGEIEMAESSQVRATNGAAENGGEVALVGAQYALVGTSNATSVESFKSV